MYDEHVSLVQSWIFFSISSSISQAARRVCLCATAFANEMLYKYKYRTTRRRASENARQTQTVSKMLSSLVHYEILRLIELD